MTEKMREQFEAWECDSDQGPQTDPVWLMYDAKTNTYPLDKIQGRWETWQASRESLVIELPDDGIENCRKEWPERGEKYGYDTFDTGYLYACKKHEEAIEAAGLKVKP